MAFAFILFLSASFSLSLSVHTYTHAYTPYARTVLLRHEGSTSCTAVYMHDNKILHDLHQRVGGEEGRLFGTVTVLFCVCIDDKRVFFITHATVLSAATHIVQCLYIIPHIVRIVRTVQPQMH